MTVFLQDYMLCRAEADEKFVVYKKLQTLVHTSSMISITRDSWKHIQMLWRQMELLVRFLKMFLYTKKERLFPEDWSIRFVFLR